MANGLTENAGHNSWMHFAPKIPKEFNDTSRQLFLMKHTRARTHTLIHTQPSQLGLLNTPTASL